MTHRSWQMLRGCRLLMAGIVAMAISAAWFHPTTAQDDESGVDDNTYTGPNFGWSVEWDEDDWEVDDEDNSGGADLLVLKTVDENPLAFTRFYAVEDLYDDPDQCAESWEDQIADGEGNTDVELTDEFDVPPAPRGGASATYSYTFEADGGRSFDNVEHFRCQYIEEDGPMLVVWIFADEDDFDDAMPLFENLIDTIEIPDAGRDGDDEGDDGDDNGSRNGSNAGSGIDDNTYTSPTHGFSVEWDEDVWTADPDAELVDDGSVGLDRLYLEHAEDDALFSGLYVEGKVDYDGDVADCIEGEEEILSGDDSVIDFEPFEDEQGDPIAGESDAGGEYAAFLATYENDDGDEYELVWYVECQTLEEGESVAIFSLYAGESSYEDELELAQEVIDSLDV